MRNGHRDAVYGRAWLWLSDYLNAVDILYGGNVLPDGVNPIVRHVTLIDPSFWKLGAGRDTTSRAYRLGIANAVRELRCLARCSIMTPDKGDSS